MSTADDDSTISGVVLLPQLSDNCRGNVGRHSAVVYDNQDHRVFVADGQGPRPDPLVYIDMFARSTTITGKQNRMLRSDVDLCRTNVSPAVFRLYTSAGTSREHYDANGQESEDGFQIHPFPLSLYEFPGCPLGPLDRLSLQSHTISRCVLIFMNAAATFTAAKPTLD